MSRVGTRERPIISPHARARIKEMGLTDHRVAEILSHPEVEYEQTNRATSTARAFVAQRGELAVAFVRCESLGIVVATVMPRTQDVYMRNSSSSPNPEEGT